MIRKHFKYLLFVWGFIYAVFIIFKVYNSDMSGLYKIAHFFIIYGAYDILDDFIFKNRNYNYTPIEAFKNRKSQHNDLSNNTRSKNKERI